MGELVSVKKLVTVKAIGCRGHELICSYGKPGGDLIEKRDVPNHVHPDGSSYTYFSVGHDFTGDVECEIKGTSGGDDKFTVTVP